MLVEKGEEEVGRKKWRKVDKKKWRRKWREVGGRKRGKDREEETEMKGKEGERSGKEMEE